jgi:lipoprotein
LYEGKDNKKIVLSVFLPIFAACGRNEKAGKNEKNGKTGRNERAGTAEKNEETGRAGKNEKAGRSLLFQHNLR